MPSSSVIPKGVETRLKDVLAAVLPVPMRPDRRIAVVGPPRSGTSWVASTLSHAASISYSFEPDVPHRQRFMQFWLDPAEDNDEFHRFIEDCIMGRAQHANDYRAISIGELLGRPFAKNVLVKWVRFPLVLEWIAAHFPDLVVVETIRHPIPQFLSWQKRGWPLDKQMGRLRGKLPLMEGPLAPYRSIIEGVEGFWSTAAAYWSSYTTMQLRAMRDGWVMREHEWYCADHKAHFRMVFHALGLEWTPAVDDFLDGRYETGRGHGPPRDPRTEIHKWEGKVADSDLREVNRILRAFEIPLYPDLDPEAFVTADLFPLPTAERVG